MMTMVWLNRTIDGAGPPELAWDPNWWPREGHSLPLDMVGYFCLAVGVVVAGWLAWAYARATWQRLAPLRLFFRIAAELQLTREQAWWLWRVARHQGLISPITLLLSPATHDYHVQQFLQDRPGVEQAVPRPLRTAREQLFD